MIFIFSDPHYQHKNICRGTSTWDRGTRDFNTIEEMDQAITDSINSVVGEDDELWCLGDFCMGDRRNIPAIRGKINCKKLHLIYGNHDDKIRATPEYQECFASCQEYKEIYLSDRTGRKHHTILFHYYIGGVWHKAQKGSFHLHGHSHNNLDPAFVRGRAIDCGWDGWRKPLSEHELCDMVLAIPIPAPADHHSSSTSYF